MWLLLVAIGLFSGFITGLMSVGGGILLLFLLILIPPLIGIHFPMQMASTLVTIQTLASSVSGTVYYFRQKLLHRNLILYFGVPSVISAFLASVAANGMSDIALRGIFAILSIGAAILMFIRNKERSEPQQFRKAIAVFLALAVGFIGGLIGVSAGFLYIPIALYLFRVPLRMAVGTGMAIGIMLSIGTLLGKVGSPYFDYQLGLILAAGAIPGAQLGGMAGAILKTVWLKRIMSFTILGISLKMSFEFLSMLHAAYWTSTLLLLLAMFCVLVIFGLSRLFPVSKARQSIETNSRSPDE